jgi:hypothetical protein
MLPKIAHQNEKYLSTKNAPAPRAQVRAGRAGAMACYPIALLSQRLKAKDDR